VIALLRRAVRFYAVGGVGIGVQLAALALLKSAAGIHYLVATALAVEIALLNNFAWHERWTWRDRTRSAGGVGRRLLRFHISNGLLSIGGNLVFMRLLVGAWGVPYLAANVASIAACAVLNFLASEWFVFRAAR
jgi:putative flippase GtrA